MPDLFVIYLEMSHQMSPRQPTSGFLPLVVWNTTLFSQISVEAKKFPTTRLHNLYNYLTCHKEALAHYLLHYFYVDAIMYKAVLKNFCLQIFYFFITGITLIRLSNLLRGNEFTVLFCS